jgi:hypothetical protein
MRQHPERPEHVLVLRELALLDSIQWLIHWRHTDQSLFNRSDAGRDDILGAIRRLPTPQG